MTLKQAYEHCKSIAVNHYENFPVVSLLVPKHMRRHLYAIYAFARVADDIADEGSSTAECRLDNLEILRYSLRQANGTDPIMMALQATIRDCVLPLSLFDRLLDAFESDVMFVAPSNWDAVLAYCHNSANPVGELFLRLDYLNKDLPDAAITASNSICTALQITNLLQDISIDLDRGRSYLPLPDNEVIQRTRLLYQEGWSVIGHARSWRLKLELIAIIIGGRAMLRLCTKRTDRMVRPTLTAWDVAVSLFSRQW